MALKERYELSGRYIAVLGTVPPYQRFRSHHLILCVVALGLEEYRKLVIFKSGLEALYKLCLTLLTVHKIAAVKGDIAALIGLKASSGKICLINSLGYAYSFIKNIYAALKLQLVVHRLHNIGIQHYLVEPFKAPAYSSLGVVLGVFRKEAELVGCNAAARLIWAHIFFKQLCYGYKHLVAHFIAVTPVEKAEKLYIHNAAEIRDIRILLHKIRRTVL